MLPQVATKGVDFLDDSSAKISNEAIEIWNKMLEALNFEFMYSVTAYKYFFWKRGIIRTNVSRNPAKSMDYFDKIEADRILKNLEIYFF